MNAIKNILALACAFSFLTACVEENFEKHSSKDGDKIVFKAAAGYMSDGPETRTVYSGNRYTVDGTTYERIEWENGDAVKIYCETASNKQEADYLVNVENAVTSNQVHTASLQSHSENSGIQWNGDGEHEFYAIYPSPTMPNRADSKTDLEGKVNLTYADGVATITGVIPTSQSPIEIAENKSIYDDDNETATRTATRWAKPDMRYSYMVARNTASPEDEGVSLSFTAFSTALEIDIIPQDDLTIREVTIISSETNITGNFTCEINEDGLPETETLTVTNGSKNLTIPLGSGVTLKAGQSLRVTALMLPVPIDPDALKIMIQTDKLHSGILNGVFLDPHKKHYLTNLTMQSEENMSGNNWVKLLPDDALLGGISIPGAANAFSYNYSTTVNNNYMTQAENFETQWNLGVRCFEIVTDRNNSGSITSEPIYCNNTSVGINNTQAFNMILDKLTSEAGEKEFAMVIFTYQPRGYGGPSRNGEEFMNCVKDFYDNYKYNGKALSDYTVLYSPNLTVADARGKIMIVARPSQEAEETIDAVNKAVAGANYEILTVKGWGSLQDKWFKRGFNKRMFRNGSDRTSDYAIPEVDGNGYESYPDNSAANYVEYYIYNRTGDMPTRTAGSQRFVYGSDQGYNVWAQEWRRVAKSALTYGNTQWFESFSLKKEDVVHTFEKAIADKKGEYVYFNSLDGFYIINNQNSYDNYWRGNMGDIGTFANEINEWFYKYLMEKGEKNITGPTGVVIMDRVGYGNSVTMDDGSVVVPAVELPGIIYRNNFKFPLRSEGDEIIDGGDGI